MRILMVRILMVRLLAGWVALASATAIWADDNDSVREVELPVSAIEVLPSGTSVDPIAEDAIWNRKVLMASPKINSGDVGTVSSVVRDAATLCALTIMAGVTQSEDRTSYQLRRIGVGYSAPTENGRTIISSDKATELGVSVGLIAKQVLKANERQLANVSLVAITPQAALFDAPSVMFRNDAHRKYLTRHLVSIDSATGQGLIVSWLLVPPQDSEHPMALINQPIRISQWGSDEIRKIHVDAQQFNFLGVPGELAFALEDLPPGDDVAWTKAAATLAGRTTYTVHQLHELVAAIESASAVASLPGR